MKYYTLIPGILYFLVGIFLSFTCFKLLINSTNIKIIVLPFLIIGIIIALNGLISILKYININSKRTNFDKIGNLEILHKIEKKSIYAYFIIFFLFWFGMLIPYDIIAIKKWNDGGKELFLTSLIFWLVGIISIIIIIKKTKKDE